MHILLVEDNLGDIVLVKEAFREGLEIPYSLSLAMDGEAAIQFLYQKLQAKTAEFPNLIFLDLNLPKKSGQEVLEEIKEHERLRCIPVVMFSTSTAKHDIEHSYKKYANCYITKPADYGELVNVLACTVHFWAQKVQLV